MSEENRNEDAILERLRELHTFSRSFVLRISWCRDLSNALTILHNASCFLIQIGSRLFGVTAAHVLRQYVHEQGRYGRLWLTLDDEPLDLSPIHLPTENEGVDIATFRVPQELLSRIDKQPLRYSADQWPPLPPELRRGVVLTGYPADRQRVLGADEIEVEQVSNCLVLDQIYSANLAMKVRTKHLVSIDGAPIRPLSGDLGGYSGAPVLTVNAPDEKCPFRLGGVLYEGHLREDEEGPFVEFKVEPASRIRADGRLSRNALW